MSSNKLKVTISGTGFAGDFTAQAFGMVPHRNGLDIELAGVCAGHLGNAQRFAEKYGVRAAYETHQAMLDATQPDIDCIACANQAHAQYVIEAAAAGVKVIVLEKPPVIWPGHAEGRTAEPAAMKAESMAALAEALDAVDKSGAKLLYAENFNYMDGIKGLVELLIEARKNGKGCILHQRGTCAHQGSASPAYDTPAKSGGGALFNKACHPLGPALYLKQIEGILREGKPIRPAKVSAIALQILKGLPESAGEHFRVMQNVDDFGRITVVFDDGAVAEVLGHDLNISGIKNDFAVTTDFGQYDMRFNPNNENELFLPNGADAGNLLLREKLPTPQGASFPRPKQFHTHGYVNEMDDAVQCALEDGRYPQSGPLMAWDTMAVVMAAYESHAKDAAFVDVTEYTRARSFESGTLPDPHQAGAMFQRV